MKTRKKANKPKHKQRVRAVVSKLRKEQEDAKKKQARNEERSS